MDEILSRYFPRGLPDDAQFSDETWEWTVGREFMDHAGEHAAYLLEQNLALDNLQEAFKAEAQQTQAKDRRSNGTLKEKADAAVAVAMRGGAQAPSEAAGGGALV